MGGSDSSIYWSIVLKTDDHITWEVLFDKTPGLVFACYSIESGKHLDSKRHYHLQLVFSTPVTHNSVIKAFKPWHIKGSKKLGTKSNLAVSVWDGSHVKLRYISKENPLTYWGTKPLDFESPEYYTKWASEWLKEELRNRKFKVHEAVLERVNNDDHCRLALNSSRIQDLKRLVTAHYIDVHISESIHLKAVNFMTVDIANILIQFAPELYKRDLTETIAQRL